jgi:hypothetical protein
MDVGARRSLRDSGFDIVLFDRDVRIICLEVLFGGVRTEGKSVVARRHEMATDVVPQGFVPKPVLVWWLSCRGIGDEEDAMDGGVFVEGDVGGYW